MYPLLPANLVPEYHALVLRTLHQGLFAPVPMMRLWLTADAKPAFVAPTPQLTAALVCMPTDFFAAEQIYLCPPQQRLSADGDHTASATGACHTIGIAGGIDAIAALLHACAMLGVARATCSQQQLAQLTAALPLEQQQNVRAAWEKPRWPRVRLHSAFALAAAEQAGAAQAQEVLAALAERGLAHRPLAVWLGPRAVTDVLSPYWRETALAWLSHLGATAETDTSAAPAYAHVQAVLATNKLAQQERAAAERSCGIEAVGPGDAVEIVDTARLQPSLWDARLPFLPAPPWPHSVLAPVLLRICPPTEHAGATQAPGHYSAALVAALRQATGTQLQAIAVVQRTSAAAAAAGWYLPTRLELPDTRATAALPPLGALRMLLAQQEPQKAIGTGSYAPGFDDVALAHMLLHAQAAAGNKMQICWGICSNGAQDAAAALAVAWLQTTLLRQSAPLLPSAAPAPAGSAARSAGRS